MVEEAPFTLFGAKGRAATLINDRLGTVGSYVEPFAGTLAVLRSRLPAKREIVCDSNDFICNFWRAVIADPEGVARWAQWPAIEADLNARHRWLVEQVEFRQKILADPDFYDVKIAGWWVWGSCLHIGRGWCDRPSGDPAPRSHIYRSGSGRRGLLRPLAGPIGETLKRLQDRLESVTVLSGDWASCARDSALFPTRKSGGGRPDNATAGVLLDPPYKGYEHLYGISNSPAAEAEAWARERGEDPMIRIAICGYEGDYDLPGWGIIPWKTKGGYGSQGNGQGRENSTRERIWFSPHCLSGKEQATLLFNREGS